MPPSLIQDQSPALSDISMPETPAQPTFSRYLAREPRVAGVKRKKDPLGAAVFYPMTLPPVQRPRLPYPTTHPSDMYRKAPPRPFSQLSATSYIYTPPNRGRASLPDEAAVEAARAKSQNDNNPEMMSQALGLDLGEESRPTPGYTFGLGSQVSMTPDFTPCTQAPSSSQVISAQGGHEFNSEYKHYPINPLLQQYNGSPEVGRNPRQGTTGESSHSPGSALAGMMEDWQAFGPHQTPSQVRQDQNPPSGASGISLEIVSPPEITLADFIEERFLQDSPTEQRIQPKPRREVPYSPLSTSSPLARRAEHLFDSPSQYSPPVPPNGQPSWNRRASAPSIAFNRIASPLSPGGFTPQTPQRLSPQPYAAHLHAPLFSPSYSLEPSGFPQQTFGGGLIQAVPKTAIPIPAVPAERPSSGVAEQHLSGKVLNREFVEKYTLGDELGSGGFGFVCSAVQTGHGNEAGVEVAVKFIFKDRMAPGDYAEDYPVPIEAWVLDKVDHPNIIKGFGLYEDDEFFYIIQELHGDPWAAGHTLEPEHPHGTHSPQSMVSYPVPLPPVAMSPASAARPLSKSPIYASPSSGFTITGWEPPAPVRPPMGRRASHDLFEAVENRRFTEDQARHIFKQIVDAVQYLHSRGIYHRDLKDENIVMDSKLNVKIIDFGSAVMEDDEEAIYHEMFRGTMNYAPPEILNGETYRAGPADVWALGILLCIILTGESCFPNVQWAQQGRHRLKRHISPASENLLLWLLTHSVKERPTIDAVVQHPWFSGPSGI